MRVDVIHLVRIWQILHVNILEEVIQIYHDSELILIWELLAPLQPVLVASESVFQWRHNDVLITKISVGGLGAKHVTEDYCDSLQFLGISNKNVNAKNPPLHAFRWIPYYLL